jgi:hypothetical protein
MLLMCDSLTDQPGMTMTVQLHTCRGLDNRVYYMLAPQGQYYNFSGCGNTFNCNHPVVQVLQGQSLLSIQSHPFSCPVSHGAAYISIPPDCRLMGAAGHDHSSAAVLGGRDACGRLPVRFGVHHDPRTLGVASFRQP